MTIDTGAEVSIVRKGLVRAEDVEPTPETIRLKIVTEESTPIMGKASVEICIGQLRIRHRALVASMGHDFILGMDLISRLGLTIDPVKEVLRLGNGEFKLNQRCIEMKPARLIAYQNCKRCDKVEQPKARFNRRKKAVVEDDEWTTARCRKDQEKDVDIGPLLRWKEDSVERPGWSEISNEPPSLKALWAQWDFLCVQNRLLKRAWESPHRRQVLVVSATRTKEERAEPQNVGSPFGRTARDGAGLLPLIEKGNKDKKKAKSYNDGIQEKLPNVHEMLHPKNKVASGRMKTRYDLRDDSVRFQGGDLV
ncbi:hypothetical protein Zmor_006763 [Zophobas morio]|uniref:Peptidase A2 domain-containing protein n=1 Tax=Zophobas morio TaxID=2755281 RepID=A0AA38IQQ9_9CUCU|nr:hypothetical protein Zmor_006763 [Zophobas morio]